MKKSTVNRIINACPDLPIAKKALSAMRVRLIISHYISEEEVEKGESSSADKKAIVNKYRDKPELKETLKMARRVLDNALAFKDIDNKREIEEDMIFCRLAYGFQPDEYLCFGLRGKSREEKESWVSDLDRYIFIHVMNDVKDAQIFNNKARTYEVFGEFYGREAISIKTKEDFPKYKAFIKNHPEFVKKQVSEGMGRSIELVQTESISPKEYFISLIKEGEHILEERIIQSNVMSKLNESSVNTIRCITVNTKEGIVIPYTFLKVGRNGSFVDNGGAGGILAGIDENTGVISTHGYDEFNNEYEVHPNTGVRFVGYSFPQWEEMRSMCIDMAKVIPSVKCIGWDMALTDKGWIVVEGNGMTQFIVPQIVFKRGIKKEVLNLIDKVELITEIPEAMKKRYL